MLVQVGEFPIAIDRNECGRHALQRIGDELLRLFRFGALDLELNESEPFFLQPLSAGDVHGDTGDRGDLTV